tara:strand:+ start:230 stop:1108 length:879 start_codon:yes stop_codon:yes gene_type:complete
LKQHLSSSNFVSGLIFIIISATAFGSAPTFAKLAFDNSITPISLQGYRFLITFVIISIATIVTKQITRPTPAHLPRLLMLAISTGLSSLCYMTSVKHIPVAVASLTFFTFPLVVAPISHLMKIDKLTQIKVLAIMIAFCGLCILLGTTYNLQWIGFSMAFAAGLFVATSFIVSKPLAEDLSPLTMAVFSTGLPCFVFAVSTILSGDLTHPQNISGSVGLVANSICHAIGLTCCYAAIARLGPTRTAVTMNIEPLISVLAAYLVLGQKITILQSLGIIGVVSGIVLMSYTRRD